VGGRVEEGRFDSCERVVMEWFVRLPYSMSPYCSIDCLV
jgi:hypothetical protein